MYKVVQLYGGAARCEVPSDWIDASTLRDVPNNQEVFVDESGSTSVIIEILEFQAAVNDVEAGRFFFNDMAHADGAVSIQINEPGYKLGEADFLGTRAVTCSVQGIQVKGKSGPSAMAAPVAVHMTVIRSKTFEADVLVTTHAPPTESGATELHEHIVNSILFLDPTLFGVCMRAADLPSGDVTEWVNARISNKADLAQMSVSAQVLVTELLEEMELLSTQVTAIDIPSVRDNLLAIQRRLESAKAASNLDITSQVPESPMGAKLAELLQKMSDLNRARSNLDSVKSRLDP